jgi:hypothetical protein
MRFSLIALAPLLLLAKLSLAEDKFTVDARSSIKDNQHIVYVKVFQGKAVVADATLPTSKGAEDPACLILRQRDANGNVTATVPLKVLKATPQGIELLPTKPVDVSKGVWSVVIQKGCLSTAHTISNKFEEQDLVIDTVAWKRDEEYLKNGVPESKVEVKQGSKTGVVSFNASFKHYFDKEFADLGSGRDSADVAHQFSLTDALVQGHLSLDASIEPSQKGQYLNNAEGELGGYLSGVFFKSLTEIGFSTKTQADQEFKQIDQTGGINAWMWVNQNWVDNIARAFFLAGDRPSFQDHLLVIAGYDYVGHLRNDSSSNSNYDGSNRLYARLYWNIPVVRAIDLHRFSPIDQKLDLDFLADVKATYDVENSKVAPEIKLSLDFKLSKIKVAAKQPSISLSFIDGRAAPTFQHFDAFLAGMKMPF